MLVLKFVFVALHLASPQVGPAAFGVCGTVLNRDGLPIPEARVRLILDSPKGGKLAHKTQAAFDGSFATRGWIVSSSDGEGNWRIEASAPGFATSVVDELFAGFGVYDIGPVYLLPPVVVSGRVIDRNGKPVGGAELRAVHGPADWSSFDYASMKPNAVTDSNGRFAIQSLPPGELSIGAYATGHADSVIRDFIASGDNDNDIEFILKPDLPLTGRVVDVNGKPIKSARVAVEGRGFWRTDTDVDRDGQFYIPGLHSGQASQFVVHAKGFVSKRITEPWDKGAAFVLRRSAQLRVQVQPNDSEERPMLTGISVRNSSADVHWCGNCELGNWVDLMINSELVKKIDPFTWIVYWEAALLGDVRHDQSGGDAPGAIRVKLADGSSFYYKAARSWRKGRIDIQVEAPLSGSIFGRVVDAESGEPIARTTVMLNRWTVNEPYMESVTDVDGSYRFNGLAPDDSHRLTVDNPSWRSSDWGGAPVREGEETEYVVRVSPPKKIVGKITIDGELAKEPIVVGLGEFQGGHATDPGWFGLGISGKDGTYSVIPKYERKFTVVPKQIARPEDGGYRRFRSEFPKTPLDWPWQARASSRRASVVNIEINR